MTSDSPTSPPPAETAPPPPSSARRRWRKLIISLAVVNALVLAAIVLWPRLVSVVGSAVEGPVATRAANQLIEEASIDEEVVTELAAPAAEEAEAPARDGPAPEPPPLTFLVMGSDSREDLPSGFGVNDQVAGRRADVIMLAVLDGDQARILSLPRDLKVSIEGHGFQRLNAAYAIGGPALTVKTVRELTGIEINHFLELDFYGFASIVDELGGVEIGFPYPARDLKSFLKVEAGLQHLDGKAALAYARSRQYQERRGSGWVTVDGSDLGRIRRQQILLYAMLESAKRPSIIFDASDVLRAAGSHITIDAALDADRLSNLLVSARGLDRENIEVATLPVFERIEGGVYYLVAAEPEASEAIAAFAGVDAESVPALPASGPVTLKVLNGNGGSGQASVWRERLEGLGFGVAGVADAASFDFQTTVVTVRPEELDKGREVVDALGFGEVQAGPVENGLDGLVIIGADALSQGAAFGG